MSDKMRWRYGDTNPVVSAVDSASVIEIGDLVYQDTDDAKPASDMRHVIKDLAEDAEPQYLQKLLADNFLGVALQRSRSGDTDPVRVATTGVFEFDYPSGTFELGDLVGVACELFGGHDEVNDGKETASLLNQEVESVTKSRLAIGRVAKRVATAAATVLIDIRSTVMTGGIKGSSPSGV
ncbi:hypothetical protein LCGC14_1042510 [marine sediment metagenome]|uniref:Uncharacterized protein n=1 Tax=marine sediment metagenome TaxID=412755 RepID=A0A0F9QXK8_9ZZZZ